MRHPLNPAQKRYIRRFMLTMTAYMALILAATYSFDHFHITGVAAYALAIAPGIPLLGVITVIGLYLAEEKDEFERTVLVESMLWGIGVTLAICSVWGLLEVYAGAPRLWVFLVGPIFCGAYGLATPLIRLRYR
ncbi:hypothetical protein QO010_002324 [Caulobacter ginsengisoli]|uniref:Uncharacterized protein n=1 Tax=Caulobacter ginsengisoli TaxID=400775 RepID=A0ABU0IRA1_9CAUL|nr:hypothetical protein [Caulobacter ginsengisoli]MDQ0464543.1 hypothetical protein [Caulobacter ginsengisoli]